MFIKMLWPFKLDIPKGAYWKVVTLYIEYTKKCLLKGHNFSYWIYILKCLLTKNVFIEWKYVYWPKKYLLNGKVPTNRKYAYWMKMWLLKGHNPLGINSGLYSFGNFFLNFFSFIFQISYSLPYSLVPLATKCFGK